MSHIPRMTVHREFARSAVVQTIVGMGLSCQNITLQAGDTLYIPEGSYHKAWPTSSGPASLHLTIAIDTSMQVLFSLTWSLCGRAGSGSCCSCSSGAAKHLATVSPSISRCSRLLATVIVSP